MSTKVSLYSLSRLEKATISRHLHQNLNDRKNAGPADPALDAFIPKLDAIATELSIRVDGKGTALGSQIVLSDRLEKADIQVDTYCRHVESFLYTEATRRAGPHIESASALYAFAFPQGRGFLDDHIPEQNGEVRRILSLLKAPDSQDILKNIAFPFAWLTVLEDAVGESEDAFREKASAHSEVGEHVSLGREAENECVDLLVRLRKVVESRAPKGDAQAVAEAKTLLAPLLNALAHHKSIAAMRATKRSKQKVAPEAQPNGV